MKISSISLIFLSYIPDSTVIYQLIAVVTITFSKQKGAAPK